MIQWNPEFETGVSQVDHDHQVLVENLNRLEVALRDSQGSARIADLIAFLERYATEHFRREEGCMEQYLCPVAGQNKIAHKQFIEMLTGAKDRLSGPSASSSVAIKIHADLCTWIRQHILKIDMNLRQCVKSGAPGR